MNSSPRAARPYFPELDGVRAIAALMVMVFHFCMQIGIGGPIILGQTGVDLFFVLSGFLITSILLLAPHGDWREIRIFYIRRTLRIFPLYYAYLLVAALLGAVPSIWFWVYLQNFPIALGHIFTGPDHFWSLAIEEQFYLFWPFLVLFLPRRWLVPALWTLVAAALLCRFPLVHMGISPFFFTLSRLDGLAAGALLAVYLKRDALRSRRPLLLALAAVSAVALLLQWKVGHAQGLAWVQITKFSLATAFYAGLVGYLVAGGQSPFNALLRAKPMRWLGKISYGLYVFHPVIFNFLLKHLPGLSRPLAALVCFSVVIAFSWTSWFAFESRFIHLKDKWAPESRPFAPPPEALSEALPGV